MQTSWCGKPCEPRRPPNVENTEICCGFFQPGFFSDKRQYSNRPGNKFTNNYLISVIIRANATIRNLCIHLSSTTRFIEVAKLQGSRGTSEWLSMLLVPKSYFGQEYKLLKTCNFSLIIPQQTDDRFQESQLTSSSNI
jgi:hypothetical protein